MARRTHVKCSQVLLEAGVDVDALDKNKNKNKNTTLHYAKWMTYIIAPELQNCTRIALFRLQWSPADACVPCVRSLAGLSHFYEYGPISRLSGPLMIIFFLTFSSAEAVRLTGEELVSMGEQQSRMR
ncbi:hypothetical protein SAY87_016242 [Trapa incisa]|uniref:Uncharacterized protein n=1 Tax=Trapa incisa TaxID=236973 RepID=A0AAN7QXB5_9MYRT|nr:hypothetical protein SAY87_016242 [Trapa incisa]